MEVVIYPIRIAAVVQYAIDARFSVLDVIIDGIGKPAGECAIESETLVVNTRVKSKRFANSRLLIFIKPIAVANIVVG